MSCDEGLENDAGLCYTACGNSSSGVGPVCWSNSPTNWVDCGMGAAVTSQVCADTIFDQVTSVANLALNIASFGAGKAVKVARDATKVAELKKMFENLKKLVKSSEKV